MEGVTRKMPPRATPPAYPTFFSAGRLFYLGGGGLALFDCPNMDRSLASVMRVNKRGKAGKGSRGTILL